MFLVSVRFASEFMRENFDLSIFSSSSLGENDNETQRLHVYVREEEITEKEIERSRG
jgi:hypothetical protein